jgi:hypothetical protein
LHANFLARRKGASTCVDLAPKYFFAELELNASGLHCASCVKIDSGLFINGSFSLVGDDLIFIIFWGLVLFIFMSSLFTLAVESKNLGGCGVCPEKIIHPFAGVYHGAQPRRIQPNVEGMSTEGDQSMSRAMSMDPITGEGDQWLVLDV